MELKPDNGYILDSLGWVYFKMGNFDNALLYLQKAGSIVKDDPTILEHIGDVYFSQGRNESALKAWEKALENSEKEEGLKERVEEKIKNLKSPSLR